MATTIFHNPRCSKSRRALELLLEAGEHPEVVEYLRTPPDRATLEALVAGLESPFASLVRRDARFVELGLSDADCSTVQSVVATLLTHPELMERPLVVRDGRVVIARPPELALRLAK